ncbi:MAG: hypothetical protein MEQ84_13260 [Mesorhizobium sp.]|nr:hypothetical protein [Mesorhizobium sp.]
MSGVYRCGSPWLCPVCAVHKAKERAERVARAAERTYHRGGQVALVVLTASHEARTPLADFKGLVQQASGKARKGKGWVQACERNGILGVIVGQEVTLSRANGWHYHQHLSIMIDGPTKAELATAGDDPGHLQRLVKDRARQAGSAVAARYISAIRAAGGTVSDKHGVYIRVANDATDASEYVAKGSLAWQVADGVEAAAVDGLAWETAGGAAVKPETRAKGSLTPWDIAEAAYAGDAWARHRWQEYMQVMPGTRSCVVSAALASKLEIAPEADAEAGEQIIHEGDEIVGRVKAPTWRLWMRHGLASTFLARVELGGEVGFAEAVEATDFDASVAEQRWQRKKEQEAAQRLAGKVAALRRAVLVEAVHRVHQHPGAGTRSRVRAVIAQLAVERPDEPPPDEAELIRALAFIPREKAADAMELAERVGGRLVAWGEAA